jgi:virginiamycin B lyase
VAKADFIRKITRTPLGVPGSGPYAVVVDSQDAAWTTLVHSGQVARLPAAGPVEIHGLGNPACRPSQPAIGPDGALWVTRNGDDRIDRIAGDGTRRSFAVPDGAGPYGLTAGPDGALWFTAIGAEAIGRLDLDGNVSMTALPDGGGMPAMITPGPDGALWFTLNRVGAIGRIDAARSITPHRLPDPACGPVGITADTAAIWFVEINAGRVGRMTPAGDLQEFDLPDRSARPHAITSDRAGGCWLTLWSAHAVARISERGEITELHAFHECDEPHGVAMAADDSVLVALESGDIARLHPGLPRTW